MIELLSEHVANQIAAGEVIQRPASAVKELLENAIDAQSTKVQLIVKDAGASLVQVMDNGMGMNKEDAEICFKKQNNINSLRDANKENIEGILVSNKILK